VSSTLSYVFCLVQSTRRPALRRIAEGMPGGGAPRALEVGDELWAIVQSVPEAEYGETALARGLQNLDWVSPRAIAHERLIESFLSGDALLPMQLFTLFNSDDRVAEHVRSEGARLRRILKRIENKVEWGLRLTYANRTKIRSMVGRPREAAKAADQRPGARYLVRKRDLLDVNRTHLKTARTAADQVYRSISRLATDARRRTSLELATPASRLLLDAAFLVPAAKSRAFQSAVRQQARELRDAGVAVSLTGPWPPYNFIR